MGRRGPLTAAKRNREAAKREKRKLKQERRLRRAEERAQANEAANTETITETRDNDQLHRV